VPGDIVSKIDTGKHPGNGQMRSPGSKSGTGRPASGGHPFSDERLPWNLPLQVKRHAWREIGHPRNVIAGWQQSAYAPG